MKTLNELSKEVHANAVEKGFWDNNPSNEHCLMMVITELVETIEADRIGKRADRFCFENSLINAFQGIIRPDWFLYCYNCCIKNTVEDELADAFIRLLDLAGARNLNVNRLLTVFPNMKKPFTENIFGICKEIAFYKYSIEERVNYAMLSILALCEYMKIDLSWFVYQKMRYNSLRPVMHNKKY